jgi:polygalacturonase
MHNVLDFGADPTGVTDSGVAFDNAIEAAVSTGAGQNRMGDRVVVPAGLYRLDNPLNL